MARAPEAGLLDPNDSAGRQTRYRVPAVDKALDILELLSTETTGLPMAVLAERLGRTISEIYRTVQLLEARGYLERSADGDRYAVTMKLFRLAHAMPRVHSISALALPIMEQLALDIEQSCHLAVLDGLDILIIAQVDSPLPRHYSVTLGARLPVWEASSGNLLLAQLPEARREALFRSLTRIVAPETLQQFRERVAEIGATGREERESYFVSGLLTISRPVYNHFSNTVAALTVPFLHHKRVVVTPAEASEKLDAAARKLSRELGYREPTEA
jgi:DNA-binding IclR family transcriptional regulator